MLLLRPELKPQIIPEKTTKTVMNEISLLPRFLSTWLHTTPRAVHKIMSVISPAEALPPPEPDSGDESSDEDAEIQHRTLEYFNFVGPYFYEKWKVEPVVLSF